MASNNKKQILFKVVTQERVVYESLIDRVTVTTQSGEITVLPRHTSLVSLLKSGELRLKKEGSEVMLAVAGGVLEVRPNSEVVILADRAEKAEDIDVERAEAAQKRAHELLEKKEQVSAVEYATLQAVLEKELARVKVGRKYRKLNLR